MLPGNSVLQDNGPTFGILNNSRCSNVLGFLVTKITGVTHWMGIRIIRNKRIHSMTIEKKPLKPFFHTVFTRKFTNKTNKMHFTR